MSLPIEESIVTGTDSIEESLISIGAYIPTDMMKRNETDSTLQSNNVDLSDNSELLIQTIGDEDVLLLENDSYVEIGRKLISAKNSLELIANTQGNPRKNPGWEGGSLPLDLQRINDENQASTDISTSVILNNTNANVKANGHHVAWVDDDTVNQLTDDVSSGVVAVPERTEMTISNPSIPDTPAGENPFLNGQNENLSALSSDDDLFTNDKVDDSKLLSVEGIPIPDVEYVCKRIDPIYHSLVKRNFKKDCRSWMYKNQNARNRAQFVFDEAARRMNTKR